MTEINLLPGNLANKSVVGKTLKTLKMVDLIGALGFGLLLIAISIVLVINTVGLNSVNENVTKLKNQVKGLQSVEQQYAFVKSRVESIKNIYSETNTVADLTVLSSLYAGIVGSGSIVTIDESNTKSEIVASFESSEKLRDFLLKISEMNYQKIVIDSILFNPSQGYQVLFKLNK